MSDIKKIMTSVIDLPHNGKVIPFIKKEQSAQLAKIEENKNEQLQLLEDDYSKKKKYLIRQGEIAKKELEWFDTFKEFQKIEPGESFKNTELINKEISICSKIKIENIYASNTVRYWLKYYSQNDMILQVSLILKHFLSKLKIKDNMNDDELLILAAKIVSPDCSNTRIAELIYILNGAAIGKYKVNVFKFDEAEFWNLCKQYGDEYSQWRESELSKNKKESSNAGFTDDSQEKREKFYEKVKMETEVRQEVKEEMKRKQG